MIQGKVFVVGIGPGDPDLMTPRARRALEASEAVVGYRPYVRAIESLLEDKDVYAFSMRQERDRCRKALELAEAGRRVALVSSGDPGIYGMAGLLLEEMRHQDKSVVEVEVCPGLSALNVAAALLGAPLVNDFAVISLSDILTPWETIERRLSAAAGGDFVLVIYNPASRRRRSQLAEAVSLLLRHRSPKTPVGVVRKTTEGQAVVITDLGNLLEQKIDMLTTVVVGNSTTWVWEQRMVTPRGYEVGDSGTKAISWDR